MVIDCRSGHEWTTGTKPGEQRCLQCGARCFRGADGKIAVYDASTSLKRVVYPPRKPNPRRPR